MEAGDATALFNLGYSNRVGLYGLTQDFKKALECYHRAGELGVAKAYNSIGYAYDQGLGVKIDKKKAKQYWELAAMEGNVLARYNLGLKEAEAGNTGRALKHYVIAVASGDSESLGAIQELYSDGHVTKDDYTKALRIYQTYLCEIKSKQRDEAAAFDESFRYY